MLRTADGSNDARTARRPDKQESPELSHPAPAVPLTVPRSSTTERTFLDLVGAIAEKRDFHAALRSSNSPTPRSSRVAATISGHGTRARSAMSNNELLASERLSTHSMAISRRSASVRPPTRL